MPLHKVKQQINDLRRDKVELARIADQLMV